MTALKGSMGIWSSGRRRVVVIMAAAVGLLVLLPGMDTSLVLGVGRHASQTIMLPTDAILLLAATHVMVWGLVPRMPQVEMLGIARIAGLSAMAAALLMAYAVGMPWLEYAVHPDADVAAGAMMTSLLVGTGVGITMLVTALIGERGAVVGAALIVVLLGSASWQIEITGHSFLPADIHDAVGVRLMVEVILSGAAILAWSRTRIGATAAVHVPQG